jgi:hypothetical protein
MRSGSTARSMSMSAGFHLVATLLLAHAPAVAADDRPPSFPDPQTQEQWKRAHELARRGMQELLQSFELFKEGLPEYGTPYIDQNGDIVIPRKIPRKRRMPHLGSTSWGGRRERRLNARRTYNGRHECSEQCPDGSRVDALPRRSDLFPFCPAFRSSFRPSPPASRLEPAPRATQYARPLAVIN